MRTPSKMHSRTPAPQRWGRHSVALAGVASVALVGAGTSALAPAAAAGSSACTTVPQSIPAGRLLLNGTKLKVHVGAIVYAIVVEAEKYDTAPYPGGFPWLAARASNAGVLSAVKLCKGTGASSLVLSVAGFRASRAGTSAVSAALAPRWRSAKHAPAPFRASVTVTG